MMFHGEQLPPKPPRPARRVTARPRAARTWLGLAWAALLCAALALPAAAGDPALDAAFQQAVDAHATQRNFVLLALRVAGAAWIAVEWVAAVVLAVGFHQLRRIAKQRGVLP